MDRQRTGNISRSVIVLFVYSKDMMCFMIDGCCRIWKCIGVLWRSYYTCAIVCCAEHRLLNTAAGELITMLCGQVSLRIHYITIRNTFYWKNMLLWPRAYYLLSTYGILYVVILYKYCFLVLNGYIPVPREHIVVPNTNVGSKINK